MIPATIKSIMDDLGLNNANEIEFEGCTYYSLEMLDEEGYPMPIGLPIIYKEQEGRYIRLTDEQVSELIKQLTNDYHPMLMNPEYLKFCKYYKGEEEEPIDKDYDTFQRFWYLEREYYSGPYKDEHEFWEGEGIERYCQQKPLLEFLAKIKNKTIKGFVAYSATVVSYHCPMEGCGFILKYKYDD